jgi:Spy/CpxP family protein refolding chaperone
MKKQALAAVMVMGFALGTLAAAQAGRSGESPAQARLRERIGDLYILRLTRALDLTEEQTSRIYPLLVRAEKDKAELQRRLGLDMRELRAELAKSPAGEGRLLELVAAIRETRRSIRGLDDEVESALEAVLTPVQRARYLIFTVDFLRGVGETLERARGARVPIKRNP